MRVIDSKVKWIIITITISLSGIWSCSEENPVEPTPTTNIVIIVSSSSDSSGVETANVVLYNANSGEAISRDFTDAAGQCTFENVNAGNYYVRISAQGFKETPLGNVSPIPFSVSTGQTHTQKYYLNILQGTFGKIDGNISPEESGFLVVAASTTDNSEYHTYTGPDGYFILFNVPYGSYIIDAIKSGYQSLNQPTVDLSSGVSSATIQLNLSQINGSKLSGKVSFLAVENGLVDISILDKVSLSAVTGLTAMIDTSRTYLINNIPSGEYIAWASYKNDGYVMDPDWIFKNPGALDIIFISDTTGMLDFSVTGAITVISPTNPPDSIIPVLADSIIPTFTWMAYPQAKEYIIEVIDLNGNLIWGGFKSNGEIRHSQIPKEWNSVEFNFDGSALMPLQSGNIYQWRIYADDDASADIQTLLSSSEDQMGLFYIE